MTCYVISNRDNSLPFQRYKRCNEFIEFKRLLFSKIQNLIFSGYDTFITGLVDGIDCDLAEAAIHFRDVELYDISLECALPCIFKAPRQKSEKYLYRLYLIGMCDDIHIISSHYHKGCTQKRNEAMIDKADLLLVIWNGKKQGIILLACYLGYLAYLITRTIIA